MGRRDSRPATIKKDNAMQHRETAISYEVAAGLIDESKILGHVNTGCADAYRLQHPQRGEVVVFCSAIGDSAVFHVGAGH